MAVFEPFRYVPIGYSNPHLHVLCTEDAHPYARVKCQPETRLSHSQIIIKSCQVHNTGISARREETNVPYGMDFGPQVRVWLEEVCVSKIINVITLTVNMKRLESYLLMKLSAPSLPPALSVYHTAVSRARAPQR